MDLKDLFGAEKVIAERLILDEPLIVINAWLTFNGFNVITDSGLSSLKSKLNNVVVSEKAKKSDSSVLDELRFVKNKLLSLSEENLEPKDLAQISNSVNAISKTITEYVDKARSGNKDEYVDPNEFVSVLEFLKGEGIITYEDGALGELRKRLFETVSEE